MEVSLLKDKEWSLIDGELCRVSNFKPLNRSRVENGLVISPITSMPYASISLSNHKFPEEATGFITHKIDFANLWSAFEERELDEEKEEVLIYWTMRHYKSGFVRLLSRFLYSLLGATNLPKVIGMICPKGTYKSLDTFDLADEQEILVNVHGLLSTKWWIPNVMR